MRAASIQYRCLIDFHDPELSPEIWNALQCKGSGNTIFMSWQWQKTWWEVFGRGKLLLLLAKKNNEPVTIAPLFADGGMLFFVGSGGSDYLDFIGDTGDPELIIGLLSLAIENMPELLGCRFYHLHASSSTQQTLYAVAAKLGWDCFDEGGMACPILSIKDFPEKAKAATEKKSLLRHEGWFNRNGGIEIKHYNQSKEILPHLDAFFEQHIARWAVTPYPSLFLDPLQRRFYKKLCVTASEAGWLRFTIVYWQQQAIAFHFGMHYNGSFLWYKPSFKITLAKHSPGEVLLRQLILRAMEEDAHYFDFGLGDEAFKDRFASSIPTVTNIGLYPH